MNLNLNALLNCSIYSASTFLHGGSSHSNQTAEGRELRCGFRTGACPGTAQEMLEHISKLGERHSPARISQPRRTTRQIGCILRAFPNFLGGKSCSHVGFQLHEAGKVSCAQQSPLGTPACAGSCLGKAAVLSKSTGQRELIFCFG